MSFTMIAPGGSSPVDVLSLPNAVSFVVDDSGSGGQINLNGLGVGSGTVSGAVDLKSFFATGTPVLFRSIPLLRAFRPVAAGSVLQAELQFLNNLHISIYPNGSVGLAAMPSINYNCGLPSGPSNVPYLQLNGPGVAGTWRVDIELRHSITN